ncbi:RIX1 superfamily domain-containing protein [Histoplasma ohiense]|nr:RIX1 superfamily domain-containing protein [Histoplasma ohiense (nom. inval.)]
MAAPICIRAATHRLLTTPAKELPSIATYVATAVADCGSILSVPQSQKKALRESDNALLVQKLKTRITNLLQDQSVEGRWTGVILVKAMIEAGQWEILRGCEAWVRGLLGILGRSDPLSTKKLSLITLTRIFRLTYPYQTLVREITTPSLPTFITSCLNLVSVKPRDGQARQLKRINPLLDTVLCVFLELLPHHPTIFRPFSSQIHGLILPIIAPFGVSGSLSRSGIRLAQRLFITLHQCAPKNTGGEEWLKACRSTISSVHQTSDHLFRGVVEQWESVDATLRRPSRPKNYDHPVGDGHPDALGSPTWQGIYAGTEKLENLLKLLTEFVSMQTSSTVAIPLGSILDLSSRLVSVTSPSSDDASQCVIDLNPEVGREERESIWAELPRLHIAVLDLLRTIVERLGLGSIPIAQNCLEQTLWIFEAEHSNIHIRIAVYKVLNTLLPIIGPSIIKPGVTPLASIIRSACQDLLPSSTSNAVGENQPLNGKSAAKPNPTTSNVDSFLNINHNASIDAEHPFPGLKSAAADLLTSLLTFLPAEHTPTYLRTEIDRTAIITKNESIMMASVLNPVPATSNGFNTPSIMPFLTRGFSELPGVESFLRPRMPVLIGDSQSNEWEVATGEDDSEPRSVTALVPSSDAVPEELTRPLNKRALDDIQTTDEQPTPPSESQNLLPSHTKRIRVEAMQSHSYSRPAAVVARQVVPPEPPKEMVTNFDTPAPAIQLTPAQNFNSAATGTEKVEIRNNDGAGEGDGESDDEIPTLNIEPDTDEDDEEGE